MGVGGRKTVAERTSVHMHDSACDGRLTRRTLPPPTRRSQEATGARSREAARRARLAARVVRLAGQASDLVADRRAEAASRPVRAASWPVAPVSRCDRERRYEPHLFF